MRKVKVTPLGRVVLFLLFLGLIGVAVFAGFKTGFIKPSEKKESKPTVQESKPNDDKVINNNKDVKEKMVISLDEWIGWKPIVDANGGLTTQPGSIFNELGLDVELKIINDATQSSNALIKGDLVGAGYTVNRYSFLYDKFLNANTKVVMPFVNNYSTGGDGIIAKQEIKSVEDLVGKKVGVPRFSEAQTLVAWLVENSDLAQNEKDQIMKNLVLFDTPDDAAKAFFAGELDAAATWQPYLSQAQETTGCHLLFSTKSAHNLILDGVVFRTDYIEKYPDKVEKFIKGTLLASDMYATEFKAIKDSMSLFATETDENIAAMTVDGQLATYNNNKELLSGVAQTVFEDMSNIWTKLGEKAHPEKASEAFDNRFMENLKSEFETLETKVPVFTAEQKEQVKDVAPLLDKKATINFQSNSAVFLDQKAAAEELNEFVKIAKIVNGSIIEISGNIASDNDDESGKKLSEQRAKTVAQYMQSQGIDSSRFVIIGNGGSKPVAPNDSEENMAKNRRTDIVFKTIE